MKHILLVLAMVFSLMASVNINKADKAELMTIKGVGEKTATSIISYRKKHGKFKSAHDIVNVKGIGEKTFAKMKKDIKVK